MDKRKLLEPLGIPDSEFGSITTSMMDLIFDLVGVEQKKRKAAEVKGQRAVLDRHK